MVGDWWSRGLGLVCFSHSVLVCSGLGLRGILDYLVSEYLRFHGSLNDSPGIYAYTH